MDTPKTKPSAPTGPMTPEEQTLFDEELMRWEPITRPLVEAIEDSERITGDDMSIIVT